MKKDCPSQRTYIATDDGYISASDAEDDDDDDSSDVATNDDAMLGGAATENLRSVIVQRVLSTQPESSEQQLEMAMGNSLSGNSSPSPSPRRKKSPAGIPTNACGGYFFPITIPRGE